MREEPPVRSSFQQAFPNIMPDESPIIPAREPRNIRQSLLDFWDQNVPESLKQFDVDLDNVFNPICMAPTEEQVGTMSARSKCMELLSADHTSLLASPCRGLPLCFMSRAGEGLPIHIQKTLFFFTSVANSILDMAHYAAPTTATNVVHDKVDPRVIRALVSTGLGLAPDREEQEASTGGGEFISMNDILQARAFNRPDEIKEPVPPISIHVGFPGVVFKDGEGKERREVFCVLTITPADAFAMIPYIQDKFLQKPKMGCQKYEQLMELYLESCSFFKEIIRYECFCNMGADERRVGLPEEYFMEPGGRLGLSTILSPMNIPFKIYNTIKNEYPGADLASIRIIGCPEMTFQNADENMQDWTKYMHISINKESERQHNLVEGIQRYDACKDKNSFPSLNLGMVGGWPLETNADNLVRVFGLPPFPLMHKFDANGARGTFSVFIASIGDADQALPDLTRAILTSFLVHSSDVDTRPEIDHLLKDKRKANPLLVLRTYHGPDADPFSALILANRQRMWSEALRSDIQVVPMLLVPSPRGISDLPVCRYAGRGARLCKRCSESSRTTWRAWSRTSRA